MSRLKHNWKQTHRVSTITRVFDRSNRTNVGKCARQTDPVPGGISVRDSKLVFSVCKHKIYHGIPAFMPTNSKKGTSCTSLLGKIRSSFTYLAESASRFCHKSRGGMIVALIKCMSLITGNSLQTLEVSAWQGVLEVWGFSPHVEKTFPVNKDSTRNINSILFYSREAEVSVLLSRLTFSFWKVLGTIKSEILKKKTHNNFEFNF